MNAQNQIPVASHSPTPWAWDDRLAKDSANYGGFVDAKGQEVCDYGNGETYYPTSGCEPSEQDREFMLRAVNSHDSLLAACVQMLAYVEMKLAHRGAQSVDQIMSELEHVQKCVSDVETAHHIGCSQTTRRVDLNFVRSAIAKAS